MTSVMCSGCAVTLGDAWCSSCATSAERDRLRAALTAMTAARDELADIADRHVYVPTLTNACAGGGVIGQSFKLIPGTGTACVPADVPANWATYAPYYAVAAAPAPQGFTTVTIDTNRLFADKSRVAELREVGK